MAPSRCERCQAELQIGDFPFCPHGKGTGYRIGDEWPGGGSRTFENMGDQPVTCQTKSDYRRELKMRNLEPMVRWSGPGDKHVSRLAMMDPYTMQAAEALVARVSTQPGHDPAPDGHLETLQMTVEDVCW